jgi:hypothetical protein
MIPLVALSVPLGTLSWQLLAHRRKRRQELAANRTAGLDVSIAVISCLVLILVTMPIHNSFASLVELTPGSDMVGILSDKDALWQALGNLILLAPLGALLPLRSSLFRSLPRVTLAALLISASIEFTQFVIQAGRVTSTDDVIFNTLGATLGALITRYWWRNSALSNEITAGEPVLNTAANEILTEGILAGEILTGDILAVPTQQRRILAPSGVPLQHRGPRVGWNQPIWLGHNGFVQQLSSPIAMPHCRESGNELHFKICEATEHR